MARKRLPLLLTVLALLGVFASCARSQNDNEPGERKTGQAETKPRPTVASLAEQSFAQIVPAGNGGVYITSGSGRIWYAVGSRATRVKNLPIDIILSQIVPSAYGNAYASSLKGVWFLEKDMATKVKETATIGKASVPPANRRR